MRKAEHTHEKSIAPKMDMESDVGKVAKPGKAGSGLYLKDDTPKRTPGRRNESKMSGGAGTKY